MGPSEPGEGTSEHSERLRPSRPEERIWPRAAAAVSPLPALVAIGVALGYLDCEHELQALTLLSLFGFLGACVALLGVHLIASSGGLRWVLCAATCVSACVACPTFSPACAAGERLWEATRVAPRRGALIALASDPAHRARAVAEQGEWVLPRGEPDLDGHTFARVGFTAAGVWVVTRPALGVASARGLFVPFPDVSLTDLEPGGSLRPDWLTDLRPTSVGGVWRFAAFDGMSGGGAPWLLDPRYASAR